MIKVKRAARPGILIQKGCEWTGTLLQAKTVREKQSAEKKYRHEAVKQALETMFHGKCAYCESKIGHVAYNHIEHYRPKKRFPQYTFTWHNLLLACPVCDGKSCKGDKFPETAQGGPLLNPCRDEPAEHLMFVYDAKARLADVHGKTQRGKITVSCLGLNRPELRGYRSRYVTMLLVIKQKALEGDAEAGQLFEDAQQAEWEYTAFARYLARRPSLKLRQVALI